MSLIKKKTYTDFERNDFILFLNIFIFGYFLKYQFIPIIHIFLILFHHINVRNKKTNN